jgi:hypothetical protein
MPADEPPSGTAPQAPPDIPAPSQPTDGEEQALEWHEVIELQTFSERKAWIEQKIKVTLLPSFSPAAVQLLSVSRANAAN